VIKKKVNQNARNAAKSKWMIDYAKSIECILWINPWQNERQLSVNDCWTCVLGNLGDDRLEIVINDVLAAFIGERERETLPVPSWKWVSTERQLFLVMYRG